MDDMMPQGEFVVRIQAEASVDDVGIVRGSRAASVVELSLVGILATLIVIIAIFAAHLAPYDPNAISLEAALQRPSLTHWMGTDQLGRDVLSRVMVGAQISLFIAAWAVIVAGLFGSLLGVIAGYFGGIVDDVIMRFVDIQLALPTIILAMVLVGAVGYSLVNLIIILGLANCARFARVTRSETLTLREREFVLLAKLAGAGSMQIMVRHIAPNLGSTFIVLATLDIGVIVALEAVLSFLGLGVQPPDPSWGQMIADGRIYLETAWWICLMPGVTLMATVLCANLLGDILRDRLNPNVSSQW